MIMSSLNEHWHCHWQWLTENNLTPITDATVGAPYGFKLSAKPS